MTTNEVRCPFCSYRFGDYTPDGKFYADIRCSKCHLQFVMLLPEQGAFIYQASAITLLTKKWGFSIGAAWGRLRMVTPSRMGQLDIVLWDTLVTLAPSQETQGGWAGRREEAVRRGQLQGA